MLIRPIGTSQIVACVKTDLNVFWEIILFMVPAVGISILRAPQSNFGNVYVYERVSKCN